MKRVRLPRLVLILAEVLKLGVRCGMKIGRNTMSEITDKLIFDFIKQQYRPHDTHEEFGREPRSIAVLHLRRIIRQNENWEQGFAVQAGRHRRRTSPSPLGENAND